MTDEELIGHFEKRDDGRWHIVKPLLLKSKGGSSVQMGHGVAIGRGVFFDGEELAPKLDAIAARKA